MSLLHIEHVAKQYPTRGGPLPVLRDVSLELNRGENVAIVGPSGSGKSTLLSIIGALEPPSGGRVVLDGQDPATLAEPELAAFRNRKIGFVFQDHHLLPQCSVLENVLMPTVAARTNVARARRTGTDAAGPRRPGRSARSSPGGAFRRRAAAGGPRPSDDLHARCWSWPTSRPATSIAPPPPASANCCWSFSGRSRPC